MLCNTNEKLLSYLKKNPLLLAPMAGVTDYPFRSFMKDRGCGILTTELVSSIALVREDSHRTKKLASFSENQQPIGVQIFGEDPNILSEAACVVERMGASFIDLNLGCPVPKIVKKGAGSAILKDPSLLSKILNSIRKKITIPLTIKVRTGWDSSYRNSLEISKIAYNEGCLWMTIHGRTRAQGYSGLSDWLYISEVKSKSPLPIIGNGDLVDSAQIRDIYSKTKCEGLMVGRGCLKNPFLFNESYKLIFNRDYKVKNYSEILIQLYNYLESFYDERMSLLQFKKLSTWFSSGFPESAKFRKNIFQIKEKEEVLKCALEYFNKYNKYKKENIVYEAFLMQGHG